MGNFDNLDSETKKKYHLKLNEYANVFGGVGTFLSFIESLRKTRPHLLTLAKCVFSGNGGYIKWSKPIYKEKIALLLQVRINEQARKNLLPDKQDKIYKDVVNLVRTINPISFELCVGDEKIHLQAFDIISEDVTLLNPYFDAIFFCSIKTLKLLLTYKIENSDERE